MRTVYTKCEGTDDGHDDSGCTDRRLLEALLAPLSDAAYTAERCDELAGAIAEIATLKRERNAVILAHNYQRPEIFQVADFVGDSLELARQATKVVGRRDRVLRRPLHGRDGEDPEPVASACSCPTCAPAARSPTAVTGDELADRKAELRKAYPDLAVVGYVNTTADVKAECDACCTSARTPCASSRRMPSEHILFVPDKNLAAYVQSQDEEADHRVGRQLLRAPPDHAAADPEREGRAAAREGAGAPRVPRGRARASRTPCSSTSGMVQLREGEPGARLPDRDRVRPLRSPRSSRCRRRSSTRAASSAST